MDKELAELAAACGVETSYLDWRGRKAQVPRDTIVAVLAALGADSLPDAADRPAPPPRLDPDAVLGGGRAWGFMTQLYSLRSRGSWGMGDLRDLADLAAWSARDLGAGFVLVNPLHAGEPAPPVSPSPYRPMSRRFTSPLYLRIEDVPEYAALGADERQRIDLLAAPLRERNHTLDDLDRDAVWAVKDTALRMLHRVRRTPARETAYAAFRAGEGEALPRFAAWCALATVHGSDWRTWPAALRDPDGPAVAAERRGLAAEIEFHTWLQWLLDEQLRTAQRAAREAGMPVGVIHDLAVGVHPGGADAWMYQRLLTPGMSVGAPPDEFNQRGQDWGQPPWHPLRLAAVGYQPFREMIRYALRHAGGLRLDHAMQVSRLWWVPEGASPADGTYVASGHGMLGTLTAEARRAGALVVGEDLGTVEDGFREALAECGVLGTSMLWFEREADGALRPPDKWRELCLATVGTHDMPPIAGYLDGDHLALRERLGLLTRPAAVERADHERQLAGILGALDNTGTPAREALHAFLARTPARLIGISLADAVGEHRTQNQPGTVDEYPNWRVPLADGAGHPVLAEDLPSSRQVRSATWPVASAIPLTEGSR